jgi:nitroimidazol reductase NimA-like FMN-containing flavoprotein (pyridoxamine 5'-phosphate oxidase superfamily)
MSSIEPTLRTQVRRLPKRAVYDRERIHAILDEGFLCHVGFVADGLPVVIPTLYARDRETLLLHGSAAGRMLKTAASGVDVCVTVTLVDGFVLARSVFHHSMNYRSVVIFGRTEPVTDEAQKMDALRCFTDKMVHNRWSEARIPTGQELKATHVLALPIEEASAKVRTGPPLDDEEDYSLPIWAGVVPIETVLGEPADDGRLIAGVSPFEVSRLLRPID